MTHITIERAKLEQVLEALKTCDEDEWHSEDDFGLAKTYDENKVDQAIASCEQALAQPVQEPVAWVCEGSSSDEKHAIDYWQDDVDDIPIGTQLYTTPPQRPWVGLKDDEDWEHIHDIQGTSLDNFSQGAVWAEAKLKEKNT
jgi:hypothetical protein